MPTCPGCGCEKPAADFLARSRRCRKCRNATYNRWLDGDASNRIGLKWRVNLRKLLLHASASAAVMSVIGCDSSALQAHIERQWLPGMDWTNYGRACDGRKWNLDHARSCSSFDLTDPAELRTCFHYSNTRPLWAADNLAQGSKARGAAVVEAS